MVDLIHLQLTGAATTTHPSATQSQQAGGRGSGSGERVKTWASRNYVAWIIHTTTSEALSETYLYVETISAKSPRAPDFEGSTRHWPSRFIFASKLCPD